MAVSIFELYSLELQRFMALLNVHRIELRAIFWGSGHIGTCWWRSWIPQTMCVVETGVAFAGEKWMYFVRFSVAEVSLVSTSSRHSCLCAKKFALLGLMVGVSAK